MILKFAFRNLVKRPLLNLIKIIGLSLALSGILLLVLFLKNELSYDHFHDKAGRIFRFTISDRSQDSKHFARVNNTAYIPAMAEYFPEIENYVRLAPVRGGVMKYNEEFIFIDQAFECDSTFFDVFDIRLSVGNLEDILNNPGSMVVTESFAKRIFGNADPSGQVLTLPAGQFYGKNIDFTITGVMQDFPQNSHLHPEFITRPIDKNIFDGWAWTYFLLSANVDPDNIKSGFSDFYNRFVQTSTGERKTEAHLQNITDIHLHSNKLREIEANSNMFVIYTLSVAALMLLFIAFTNYSNLNSGMAGFAYKFLFITKLTGSSDRMILKYFLVEGVMIVILSLLVCAFILAPFYVLIQKYFALNLFTGNMLIVLSVVLLFSLLGLLTGVLPVLKQGINGTTFATVQRHSPDYRKNFSRSLIVLQNTISIALIIAVIVIGRQTGYALDSSMSVEENNLVCLKNVHTSIQQKFEIFKEELLKYSSIERVSAMFEPPGGEANDMFQFTMEGYIKNEINKADNYIGIFPCDYSFPGIFGLNFLSGSDFSQKNEDNDGAGEYIINESAMRRLHYSSPAEITGKKFQLVFHNEEIRIPAGSIKGVVQDFHLSGIKKKIEPLVLFKRKELWLINFVISFRPGNQTQALSDIESAWKKMFPDYPFQYEFISSMYRDVYKTELLQTRLLSIFTFISLFICSMGLLGMSLLTTQRRTKEIGLRKINGAGIPGLMVMLNLEFLKWIMLSFVLAVPLAYLAMNKWLNNYAYKTALSWWIFVLAGLAAVLIAALTVSVHSWKVSNRNPLEALRYE